MPQERAEEPAALKSRGEWARSAGTVFDWLKTISLALVVFIFVRGMLVEAFKIPSGSMEGTLLVGDFLLVNKLVYGAEIPLTHKRLPAMHAPRRGDVVVFVYPLDPSKYYVKRVAGIAGDTVAMHDGILVRNGATVREPYVEHTQPGSDPADEEFRWQYDFLATSANATERGYHPSRNNWGPIVVPAHHLFMLGDNRDNSQDSRYWGFVPDSLVRGRPLFVYYSYAPDSAKAFDFVTRIRWQRLLARIE